MMNFEEQVNMIKNSFPFSEITISEEGGCRFLHLSSFVKDPENENILLDCLFSCDFHLGYESRLWFPRKIKTIQSRNWNNENIFILGKTWSAFSFKAKGEILIEKLLSHLKGAI